MWRLFYNDDGKRKRESAVQLLFYGIALAFCKENDLDCSPETSIGSGLVDFKFSRGFNSKILVEMKWSTNDLKHALDIQLPAYVKSEDARQAFLIIIDAGTNDKRINDFASHFANANRNNYSCPIEYMVIDGRQKKSASKK